jgi:hypothetical protein
MKTESKSPKMVVPGIKKLRNSKSIYWTKKMLFLHKPNPIYWTKRKAHDSYTVGR